MRTSAALLAPAGMADRPLLPMSPAAGQEPEVFGEAAAQSRREKIWRTVVYMQEHLKEPLQVCALAAVANVSASHYFALFKELMGRTPIRYFIGLKIHRACELFDAGALNVKEAAGALGYDDPFYFSRLFKTVTGVSPNEYRRMPEPFREAVRNGGWHGQPLAPLPGPLELWK